MGEQRLYSVAQAGQYLSFSVAYIKRLVKEGKLTSVKCGRATRFNKSELDRFADTLQPASNG